MYWKGAFEFAYRFSKDNGVDICGFFSAQDGARRGFGLERKKENEENKGKSWLKIGRREGQKSQTFIVTGTWLYSIGYSL